MARQSQYWTSYRSLFRFTGTMYRLDPRTRFPAPVRLDVLAIFAFMLVILYVPCWVLEPLTLRVFHVGKGFSDFAFSVAAAYFFANFDPAGKFLPFFVLDVILFYLGPKKHRVGTDYRPDRSRREDCEVFVLD